MKTENMPPDSSEEPENSRKLFIGGLNRDTTDEGLATFYQQWGQTSDVIVMKDPTTKKSRGFGFVTFAKISMVDAAMNARPHVIDGKTVDPKRAVPREEGQRGELNISSKRLYLSNVREDLTEDAIRDYFLQFGSVEKVDVPLDKTTNKPRGFGFVTFDDYDPVDKCILQKVHMINGVRCEAKKALNKEEMAKAQQNRERLDRFSRSRGMGREMGSGRGGYAGGGYGGGYGGGAQGGYGAGGYGGYGGGYPQGYGAGYGGYAGYQGQAGGWGDQAAWAGQTNGAAAGAVASGAWGNAPAAAATPAAGGWGAQAGGQAAWAAGGAASGQPAAGGWGGAGGGQKY